MHRTVRPNVDGDQSIGKVLKLAMEVWLPCRHWSKEHTLGCPGASQLTLLAGTRPHM
jgi:hypothetical protein